jgi:hypothetical protein
MHDVVTNQLRDFLVKEHVIALDGPIEERAIGDPVGLAPLCARVECIHPQT